MTTSVATDVITVSAETITVNPDGTFSINVKNVSDLTDALLAARKEAYTNVREAKTAERTAAKAAREAKKAERAAAATKRNAEALAKAEQRVKDLKAKTAGTSGRRKAAK